MSKIASVLILYSIHCLSSQDTEWWCSRLQIGIDLHLSQNSRRKRKTADSSVFEYCWRIALLCYLGCGGWEGGSEVEVVKRRKK